MLLRIQHPMDLASTLLGGQAFRWRRDSQWFYGVVFGNIVKTQMGEGSEGDPVRKANGHRPRVNCAKDYAGESTARDRSYPHDPERPRRTRA